MKGLSVKKFFSFVFCLLFFISFEAFGAQKKKIFFVLWDGCEEACQGFQDYLKTDELEVEFIKRNLAKKIHKIPEIIQEIEETSPDLVVTWGTLASLEILGSSESSVSPFYGRIPALFMVVSQPVESGLVSSLVLQGRNITGVSHLVTLSTQLQNARQIIDFKRLGILYNPLEVNAQVVVEQLKEYGSLMRFDLIEKPLPLKNGKPDETRIPSVLAELSEQQVDLVYLAPDAFMNQHRDIFTSTATELFLPVFSASEGAVRDSEALFAFVHRYYNVGQLAGQKAVKILRENIPAYDIAIESPQRPLLVVNMSVAEKIGVYPPLSLINNAELIFE